VSIDYCDANKLEIDSGEGRGAAWQQGGDAPPLGADDFGAFEGNAYSEYGLSDDGRGGWRARGTAEVHAQVAMSVLVRPIAKAVR
jgi:hypothetical protein